MKPKCSVILALTALFPPQVEVPLPSAAVVSAQRFCTPSQTDCLVEWERLVQRNQSQRKSVVTQNL